MFNFFSDKFNNLKQTVSNTAKALVGNVVNTVGGEEEFSEFVLDDMEELLISADLGVNYASELVDKLRNQEKIKPSAVKNYLKNEFMKTLDHSNKSVSPGDYFMLKCTYAPSVIVECGFLSNEEEEKLLLNDEYQEKIIDSIYLGIIKFLQIK